MQRIVQYFTAQVKGTPIIADQFGGKITSRDAVTGKPTITPSEFNPDEHKKYHAKYYFQKDTGKPMTDADRTQGSLDAYNEFLEGLEQINNQEYLDSDFLGKAGKSQEDKLPPELEDKARDVQQFATWTRTIRTRSSAHTAQQFAKKLKTRAQIGIMTPPSSVKSDMIPIRGETYQLLTRPLEADFTWLGAIIYVVQIAIYCNIFWVQMNSIVGICSNSYMCPFQTKSSGLPVLAPPVVFRQGVAATQDSEDPIVYYSTDDPWEPHAKESCKLGSPNCDSPGYLIQWPYIEVDPSKGMAEFPAELIEKGNCTKVEMGERGWVFDPFLPNGGDIRPEAWVCNDVESIAFNAKHVGDNVTTSAGTMTFHYRPSYYLSNQEKTLECMQEAITTSGGGQMPLSDWLSPSLSEEQKGELRELVVHCIKNKDIADRQECACSQRKWLEWATGLYWPGSTPTKTCEGGVEDGTVCVAATDPPFDDGGAEEAAPRCAQGTCEREFEDQVDLKRNRKYGCWFTSPLSSSEQLPAVYFECGLAYSTGTDKLGTSETLIRLQNSIDLLISKRTLLVLVFLIKEGCILTALALVPIIGLVLLSLLLLLYYILVLPIKVLLRGCGMQQDFMLNSIVVLVKQIIFVQLRILWTMCINFSTSYRIIRMLLSLFRGLVNPSLRDLDVKLTTVANTVFSLVLLVATADGSVDAQVVTSLCLSLFQLLYAMNTEKVRLQLLAEPLKDVNENRLSKFEFALLITKIMEDLLEEDVQYNWVQHFNSPHHPLKPFTFTFPQTLGSSTNEYKNPLVMGESFERLKNLEEKFDDILFSIIGEEPNTMVVKTHLGPFPSGDLLKKFGHDGQAYDEEFAHPTKPPNPGQTVNWRDTGEKYEGDKVVVVELVAGKTDRELLNVATARSASADGGGDDFFDRPLFSSDAEKEAVRIDLGEAYADLSFAPEPERSQVGYSMMASGRTPVNRKGGDGGELLLTPGSPGPAMV